MALVSLHSIRIAFGGPLLLDSVFLDIHKGQRICFLGRNGVGKSTFMKIIAGEVAPDSGEIIVAPGVNIAYLSQEVPQGLSGPVLDIVLSGAGQVGDALVAWHRLVAQHHDSPELHSQQQFLDTHDGWRVETSAKRALDQLGLDGTADVATLSGGMRRRVFLARALVREPEVLLLDEPTNHLDIDSIAWLESFILGSKLTVLFVTHDRRLLRRLATRIIELDRGRLVDWSCDYDTFLQRKQAVLEAEEKDWGRFDKLLAQEETWIRRGIKARRTRNEGRVRALERMREERRKRRERSGEVSMAIGMAQRSGERVLEARGVGFSYGDKAILTDLSLTVGRGDRIGIMGPNGCGKTTLLNVLLGKTPPQQGTVVFGASLAVSYFDQLREVLEPEKTVWENVALGWADTVFISGKPRHVISYLADFLFTSDRAKSPVKQLSGGERNRLMLARLFTQPANVLVFDEPTNDLDTETLELLEELLLEYAGTVLVVSHDREFLNNVVTTTLAFEGNGVFKEYVGGYDDWERQRIALAPAAARPAPKREEPAPVPSGPKKLTFKEKQALAALPVRIEALETERDGLCAKMADPASYGDRAFAAEAGMRISRIEDELAAAYALWEELDGRSA